MENKELARNIIELVGNEENISVLTHCATRLRFNLKDNSKADLNALKNLDGVLTAQLKSGQLQVVIGAKVQSIYEEAVKLVHISEDLEVKKEKTNKVNMIIETISGIFSPTLPVLIGCGMFKAIVSLLTNLDIMQSSDNFIVVLSMMGDLIFYFFPFFLAVSAARKFKVSEYLALALAAAYMYPTIMDGAAMVAETGIESLNFLGFPMLFVNYKSTVIPIILSVWVLSLIYKRIDKLVPDALKILLTSMIVMFIMIPFELIALGPIGSYLGTYIAEFVGWFYDFGGFIAAALLGGTRSLLTMMGMHYALAPLQIQQIAELGTSTLLVSALTANFAQAGAAFGCALKIKNKAEKSIAFSASLSAFLGITEPAMYGVNLRYKKPFMFALLSSAIAAAFLSFFNAGAMAYAPPGLFTIITYTADNFAFIIIGVVIASGLAGVLSYLFGVEEKVEKGTKDNKDHVEVNVISPIVGKTISLLDVKDDAFASMGEGFAIIPEEGKVYAPFDGKVSMIFPTSHAIGLISNDGVELLIHIGIDTVNENGNGFSALVKTNDEIKQGDLLIEFDLNTLSKKYDMTTSIIVTNTSQCKKIEMIDNTDLGANTLKVSI